MSDWIRESNLIEGVDDPKEDAICRDAWKEFLEDPVLLACSVLELHRKIMKNHLGSGAGRFRTYRVSVGGRICPPWQQVPDLHAGWMDKWSDAHSEALIKIAHIEWEKIHPFVDGNGRTGRMIMNWQRVKAGLEPLNIKFEERGEYYKWFK